MKFSISCNVTYSCKYQKIYIMWFFTVNYFVFKSYTAKIMLGEFRVSKNMAIIIYACNLDIYINKPVYLNYLRFPFESTGNITVQFCFKTFFF